MKELFNEIVSETEGISSIHRNFLHQQRRVHDRFMSLQQNLMSHIKDLPGQLAGLLENKLPLMESSYHDPNSEVNYPSPAVLPDMQAPVPGIQSRGGFEKSERTEGVGGGAVVEKALTGVKPVEVKPQVVKESKGAEDPMRAQFLNPVYLKPEGPTFTKAQLEILASGKISEVFGPMFKIQDDYERQVRLPEYPLLLADRITGLKAEPGSMGKGVIWTETDVVADGWYINDIYMPAGVTVESGQCDLTLVSYLGADFKNRGKRVYRLLGCDLMYYGEPPRVGDTLCYQIHVDGHANLGETRIFFFRYDCRINGELRLSVRNAQAGFFSDEELANSGGILWTPETGEHAADHEAKLAPPAVSCTRSEFSMEQVKAFSEGRVYECFGPGFEITETHSKTPKLQSGMMLLIDKVACFDSKGGPWGRGYLRVENKIPSDAWYLVCHFKNDPCMPGTLMSDACLQALAFYMTAMGYTLERDGWRFDPVSNEIMNIKCRGQVTPESENLVYELFVEEIEIVDGLYPTIYADILATCDGLKMLHIRRMGLRLVPDWPLDCWPHLLAGYEEKRPVAKIGDMEFGYKSLMACAFGKPSDAFGPPGEIFDTGRHIARLPGPPYHFMTRVSMINATPGAMKTNETIEVEYDIPADAWYFDENGNRTMPFCVLMEVALQPCGWLAVFEGGPATSEKPLYFRNLDGTGKIHKELFPDTGIVRTRTTQTNIARIAGVILVNFDVKCFVEETLVYEMKTGFGFFPAEALSQQVGLDATVEERKWLDEPNDFRVELTERPDRYCGKGLRLPKPMLLMIDRVTGYWPEGGPKGLGRLRAEKTVNISEWFFKAHFFHDPVQPGSLGVEAMVQLLEFYMLHEGMGEGIENPRFEPVAVGNTVTWKYRGQVTPDRKRISVELNIVERGRDERGAYAVAEAWLWADDLRIFNVKNLRMNIVPGAFCKGEKITETAETVVVESVSDPLEQEIEAQIRKQVEDLNVKKIAPVKLSMDRKTAVCASLPLSLFPIKISERKGVKKLKGVSDPQLDIDGILDFGRQLLGTDRPRVGEDFAHGFYDNFTRHVILDDAEAFKKVKDKSVLYLANHQVQLETLPFFTLLRMITGNTTCTIGNITHQTGWLGPFNDFMYAYPGVKYPKNIIYFDQTDRMSMFNIIDELKGEIEENGISVFLHVEGRLGLTCRKPVRTLSSVFIDFAQDLNIPIVPVRFTGGLPVRKMETTLDFPVGYAKQDYYLGRPILPSELLNLPYAEKRKLVIKAINDLGPPNEVESPNPPNHVFMDEVHAWMSETGAPEVKAALFKVLESIEDPTPETKILIQIAHSGEINVEKTPQGRWLAEFATWLFDKK